MEKARDSPQAAVLEDLYSVRASETNQVHKPRGQTRSQLEDQSKGDAQGNVMQKVNRLRTLYSMGRVLCIVGEQTDTVGITVVVFLPL